MILNTDNLIYIGSEEVRVAAIAIIVFIGLFVIFFSIWVHKGGKK